MLEKTWLLFTKNNRIKKLVQMDVGTLKKDIIVIDNRKSSQSSKIVDHWLGHQQNGTIKLKGPLQRAQMKVSQNEKMDCFEH